MKLKIAGYRSLRIITAVCAALLIPCLSFAADEAKGASSQLIPAREVTDPASISGQSHNEIEVAGDYLRALVEHPGNDEQAAYLFEKLKATYIIYLEMSKERGKGVRPDGGIKSNPDMFFIYLKNICATYKNQGEYDKAIRAIQWLIKIDNDPNYYVDIGNIYLHGLNDARSAIDNFETAIKLAPHHASAYTDLGLAYEIAGDYNKAVVAYRRGAYISPLGDWAMYGAKRIDAITLSEKGQIIKDWYFIGPLTNSKTPDNIEKAIFEPVNVNGIYKKEDGRIITWFRPYDYNTYGYTNLSNLFSPKDFVSAYALTYIYAPSKTNVLFKVGSDDGITIWLNRKKILTVDSVRSAALDNDTQKAELNEGWNEVLLKVTQTWGSWGFYFRVTDLDGKPVEGLIFDPLKDTGRANSIYETRKKERIIKAVGLFLSQGVLGLLIGLLLLSIAFNIYNAIKIKKLREDFIASITHDLKIPLSAIMGFAEMLMDGKRREEEKVKRYYKNISDEAARLNRYINRILEFSKMEARKKVYSLKTTDPVPVIEKAIDIYRNESHSEGLEIGLKVRGTVPAVELDEDAFTHALINLLNNADKYSPKDKRIDVEVTAEARRLIVSVRDHGIGIRQKDRNNIFKKFYRSDDRSVTDKKGVGLGLAFVKNIIEAHKGTIRAESIPGSGSIFIIELPVPHG